MAGWKVRESQKDLVTSNIYPYDLKRLDISGIPSFGSCILTIFRGAHAWSTNNEEGRVYTVLQFVGTPFSLISNLSKIALHVSEAAAVLGIQATTHKSNLYLAAAYSGIVVGALQGAYHIYGLSQHLLFLKKYYGRESDHAFFSYLFSDFLSIDLSTPQPPPAAKEEISYFKKCVACITQWAKKEKSTATDQKCRQQFTQAHHRALMLKMYPLTFRLQTRLVQDMTDTLNRNGGEVSSFKMREWFGTDKMRGWFRTEEEVGRIETELMKKTLFHILSIAAAAFLVIGLTAALCSAPAAIPFILLGISSLLTIVNYFYEYGVLQSKGWKFEWAPCIPSWIRTTLNLCTQRAAAV